MTLRGVWFGFLERCEECGCDLSPSGFAHDLETDWAVEKPSPLFDPSVRVLCDDCASIWEQWLQEERESPAAQL